MGLKELQERLASTKQTTERAAIRKEEREKLRKEIGGDRGNMEGGQSAGSFEGERIDLRKSVGEYAEGHKEKDHDDLCPEGQVTR